MKTKKAPLDLSKLPPNKARLAIAKDALKQLKLKKIVPRFGMYVETTTNGDGRCEACALGALLVAECGGDVHEAKASPLWSRLQKYFDYSVLLDIEGAFEGFSDRRTREMYSRFKKPETRMRKILENIIENNGDFKVKVAQ